jgi:peptide-methionine (S)-S-oxide reductase
MPVRHRHSRFVTLAAGVCALLLVAGASATALPLPQPAVDTPASATTGLDKAVFAGGCFWGIQAVFAHVDGVTRSISGYAGGSAATARYPIVSTGTTGHAESVEVTFDPRTVSYGELLRIFFSVALDPTERDRQGPDVGSQYRSVLFYRGEAQKRVAEAYLRQLTAAHAFSRPIVTEVVPLPAFYPAEAYHQDYLARHPTQPYIVYNDLPKLAALREHFADRYVERPSASVAGGNLRQD